MINNIGKITYINGEKGIYNGKIHNSSVRYARNAVNNFNKLSDKTDKYYEIQYMPIHPKNGQIDNMALMGASYELLGATEVSIKDMENCKNAKALDINKDCRIDIGEFASYVIVSDILSTAPYDNDLRPQNVNGKINEKGIMSHNLMDAKDAYSVYKSIYENFNLKFAANDFMRNSNNL